MEGFIGNQPEQQSNEMQKKSWDTFTETDKQINDENVKTDAQRTKSKIRIQRDFHEKEDAALDSFRGRDTASLYNPSLDYIKNVIGL